FNYEQGAHNVMQVNSTGFEACLTESNTGLYTSGNDSVHLLNEGQFWYICGLDDHCDLGQKLSIHVVP
uniref:Phytocyanin domain-containing protein n=1 Tax=Kalanchoe fedtschenkoi TaxID=63787 RepID=A0A7N0VC01_KALFE